MPWTRNVSRGYRMMSQRTQGAEKIEKCINALEFTKDWTSWRETLKEGIATAKGLGLSDQDIQDIGVRLGDFLAEKVCPATPEEELIKDMWTVASPEERRTLARVMFRMLD